MDLELAGWQLFWIVCACVALGAAGGLASDLTEPVRRLGRRARGRGTSSPPPPVAEEVGDNELEIPGWRRAKPLNFRAGLLGPMFIGVVAALAATFLLAVKHPAAPSNVDQQGVLKILEKHHVSAKNQDAVKGELAQKRKSYVPWEDLIPIGLIAGFGGVEVLRTARGRLMALLGTVAFQARTAGIREGTDLAAKTVEEAQTTQQSPPSGAPIVSPDEIRAAGAEHVELLMNSGPGNPEFA
jgi:hypothetical protein